MTDFKDFRVPYSIDPDYNKRVAYFCMEFAIDQALKIYSGGLGYLAGSHLRAAYQRKQNFIAVGILWKLGYYDQEWSEDGTLKVVFRPKQYNYLKDTGITFDIYVNQHPVKVKVWYLQPETFGTAPLFLLSTDLPENDYLARSICHRLYDSNTETKVAQYILLGIGGAKLMDILGFQPEIYHFNEAHPLPAAFYLYQKYHDLEQVRRRVMLTTHTPVEAGNEKHDLQMLHRMGFFAGASLDNVRKVWKADGPIFNQTLMALRSAHLANGVSAIHGEVSRKMWSTYEDVCPITHITNAQDHRYWQDAELYQQLHQQNDTALLERKQALKKQLFEIVADQTGKIFDPKVLTIVWARRFAGYKRPDLLTRDFARFERFIRSAKYPVQIIWAGRPYPTDHGAVDTFNHLARMAGNYPNVAVLMGYELTLSKRLKQGADIWLNNPRIPREASGTSGMSAAMNGAINLSTWDGWIPEWAKHGHNAFVVPAASIDMSEEEMDLFDLYNLYEVLEEEVLTIYYDQPAKWLEMVKNSLREISPAFSSDRMVDQYYNDYYEAPYEPRNVQQKNGHLV